MLIADLLVSLQHDVYHAEASMTVIMLRVKQRFRSRSRMPPIRWRTKYSQPRPTPRGTGDFEVRSRTTFQLSTRTISFGSCPFVALGSELARGSDGVRPAATAGLLKLVDAIEGKLKGQPSAAAQKAALLMLSTMVGALTLA
jgi:hypothetical protein